MLNRPTFGGHITFGAGDFEDSTDYQKVMLIAFYQLEFYIDVVKVV